ADLFVFPSLYEGFGLPPLEAISLRCPVILADIPVLKEIFNDTVLYFNPLSENDMANKMLSVLQNSNIRENLIKMEENRLTFFNKNVIINQHIELFKKVARGQNNEDSLA
ncbi:MAG TPA: glycosyltransferase, partial [bacterium]|nr:glycosyltransferase [bacterium]